MPELSWALIYLLTCCYFLTFGGETVAGLWAVDKHTLNNLSTLVFLRLSPSLLHTSCCWFRVGYLGDGHAGGQASPGIQDHSCGAKVFSFLEFQADARLMKTFISWPDVIKMKNKPHKSRKQLKWKTDLMSHMQNIYKISVHFFSYPCIYIFWNSQWINFKTILTFCSKLFVDATVKSSSAKN